MIIVPVEKKFDWVHAPLVLFGLVILNCLVFFLYQSNDEKKIVEALTAYEASGYFEQEWPVFQTFLASHHQDEKLKSLQNQVENAELSNVTYELLSNEEFSTYLLSFADKNFENSFYAEWKLKHEEISHLLDSTSSLRFGLQANHLHWYSVISYQFLHGDTMHILGNMFFLVVCGFAVEAAIGHWWFLSFYLISGVVGGVAHIYFNPESNGPLIGASGAISGVMAMYLAVFRLQKIEFFYWIFFFVGYFRAPALLILPFYIGKEIYSYFHAAGSNVAFMAHAGGFVAGALLIGMAILFRPAMVNRTYISTASSIEGRQEKLAEIYESIEKFRFERALSLINKFVHEFGSSFELARLRCNLLKISRGADYSQSVLDIFGFNLSSQGEIKVLDKIWRDNPEVHAQLKEAEALKLGLQLASLENPESAEHIFLNLHKKGYVNPAMSAFASKLAKSFKNLHDQAKQSRYELFAQQFSSPLTHGISSKIE